MKRLIFTLLLTILVVCNLAVAEPPAITYTITDLGTLGGDYSEAYSINASGQVVGGAQTASGFYHAFLYSDGVMRDLGTLGGGVSGACGINNSGHVVGGAQTAGGSRHAFLYSDGVMRDLGTLGGGESGACGINNSGHVVGWADTVSGFYHAFLYSDGVMKELGALGGDYSEAYGINNSGQVVGGADTASGFQHAFLYSDGVMKELGALGGDYSEAYGINNSGHVVGWAETASEFYHAFLYSDGVMRDLGTLGGEFSGACGINDSGQVVGGAGTASGFYHAFLYSDGVMRDLNSLIPADSGWTLHEALDINDAGQIVGRGYINDEGHAFLMTPILPVILVHGWRGSQETWETLKPRLDAEGIPNHTFDYSPGLGDPREYAMKLKEWIEKLKADTGYMGKFDIVCHSMGAMVSRWYMEELRGDEDIRQWIGIAPVNNGAAIADLGDLLVPDVLRWFFPDLPGTEEAVKQMKIKSSTLAMLNYDIDEFNLDIWGTPQHLSSGIIYRNIMGINSAGVHSFSSITAGKTRVVKKDRKGELYPYWTRQGDGVVAMEQSMLNGANVGNEVFEGVNHNTILDNPEVITKVVEYLKEPSLPLVNNCPTEDADDDHEVTGKGNQGILLQGEYKPIEVSVDSSVKKATVVTTWPGSELNLTLISPTGKVMEAGVYPVIEYWKGENSIWYVIDMPEPGVWTAGIDAVDVPGEGESYTFVTFYSSLLTLELATAEDRYSYNIGDDATILAKLSEEDVPITGASVRAEVRRPDELIDEFVLYDDGSHGDALSNDGNYTNVYSLLMPGNYDFTVFASGTFERIEFMTLWVAPILGDVSQNGEVSAYDASLVLQHVVGLITLLPEQQQAADVTGNGTITALDAALILQYTVGLITEFPAQGAPILVAKDDNPLAPFIPLNKGGQGGCKGDENQLLTKIIAELENSSLSTEQKRVLEQLKRLLWQRTLPKQTALLQNYPNPFNPETWIPFQLAQDASVTIRIYNIKGQLIRTLHLGNQQAGIYVVKDKSAYWDGRNHIGEKVASGIYFYTLQAEGFKATRRMVILK